jgi:hypothetical protein
MDRGSAAVLCAALLLACGDTEPAPEAGFQVDAATLARIEEAHAHLLANAHELVRREVLETCEKWHHLDKECVDQEVRVAQLECWAEAGRPELELVYKRPRRPRARNIQIMMMQNLCMAERGWRRNEGDREF